MAKNKKEGMSFPLKALGVIVLLGATYAILSNKDLIMKFFLPLVKIKREEVLEKVKDQQDEKLAQLIELLDEGLINDEALAKLILVYYTVSVVDGELVLERKEDK